MSAERVTRKLVTGWGSAAATSADMVRLADTGEVASAVQSAGPRGVLARGLGRAYGDAAQNAGGALLDMPSMPPSVSLDAANAQVTAGAGVSLDQLMRTLVPLGFFVPVTPGTRQVSVGGAIAADIHGKNHHADGTWGQHVGRFGLTLADGSHRDVTLQNDAEAFWATTGGMGLTGVVTDATVNLVPVETSRMLVHTERASNLDDLMALMERTDATYRYSVAWVDLVATGSTLGRSVLTAGDHAPRASLTGRAANDPLAFAPGELLTAPPVFPSGLLNKHTVRAFNEVWFRKAPKRRLDQVQSIGAFFHPLDGVGMWSRLYGPRGFLQYQFVVPFGEEATLRKIVERLAGSGAASFLAVLKRFGASNPGPLSFPMPGWTLTLDIPAGLSGLNELLDATDRDVVDVGGRLYLAKDSRLDPALFARMYPRLDEWRETQARLDPTSRFQSDLNRRLGLTKKVLP
jgi:decaprenylphospho-beta-D-ribofuranose 2-oxidase